jgi:hypothetical protein
MLHVGSSDSVFACLDEYVQVLPHQGILGGRQAPLQFRDCTQVILARALVDIGLQIDEMTKTTINCTTVRRIGVPCG